MPAVSEQHVAAEDLRVRAEAPVVQVDVEVGDMASTEARVSRTEAASRLVAGVGHVGVELGVLVGVEVQLAGAGRARLRRRVSWPGRAAARGTACVAIGRSYCPTRAW